jgi:phosphoribosylformimino-5-aminoimidazole carboxamide ribotide isomerase
VNVIPAIDLQAGKCVRLFKGDFDKSTEYSDDPVAVARSFAAMQTTELHIVDLDGARSGTQSNRETIATIAAETKLAIQLGGGLRNLETLEDWYAAGVARCVVGSLAVTAPDTVREWFARFGADKIVLALDVNLDEDGLPLLTTHGWTQPSKTSIFECIAAFREVGLKHVLCTDVSRDGAMTGPNIDLYARILDRYPEIRLQASGGVRDIRDLEQLRQSGIPAAITGRALLEGEITAQEVVSFQRSA